MKIEKKLKSSAPSILVFFFIIGLFGGTLFVTEKIENVAESSRQKTRKTLDKALALQMTVRELQVSLKDFVFLAGNSTEMKKYQQATSDFFFFLEKLEELMPEAEELSTIRRRHQNLVQVASGLTKNKDAELLVIQQDIRAINSFGSAIEIALDSLVNRAKTAEISARNRATSLRFKLEIFQYVIVVLIAAQLAILYHNLDKKLVEIKNTNQHLELEISARQEAETELQQALKNLKQTQAKLVHNEKMSSLGQLVAGVAHEINNPLSFIDGNIVHAQDYFQDLLSLLELYQQHYPAPPEEILERTEEIDLGFIQEDLAGLFKSMKVGSDRITTIVKSLRTFSRLDESDLKEVDVRQCIESALIVCESRFKTLLNSETIEIIKNYEKLPELNCYPGELNQVFMNIIRNAIDALSEDEQEGKIPTILISTETMNAGSIVIKIRDNGKGMSEEVRGKIFDPFFTTKPVGKGTGLGLSVSHQIIVERHNGTISCDSTPGRGTEFIIELPVK
ncbi:MAG: PAS domain-containing sensor histidine kinase [Okeania sp. SIO2H7]|nr:PAS domain-containing sensor histidine kinase [Okeania sp. SIO2H7]